MGAALPSSTEWWFLWKVPSPAILLMRKLPAKKVVTEKLVQFNFINEVQNESIQDAVISEFVVDALGKASAMQNSSFTSNKL